MAEASERVVLGNANQVLQAFKAPPLATLAALWDRSTALLATYPELDHYGPRADARYLGPLRGAPDYPVQAWPDGPGPRVFACLRPDTPEVAVLFAALARLPARIVCVAPGFSAAERASCARPHLTCLARPVALAPLLATADACVSYGAEGTVQSFLEAGVPQLLVPRQVEAQLAARRLEALGVAHVLRGPQTVPSVLQALEQLLNTPSYATAARAFAARNEAYRPEQALAAVVASIEGRGRAHTDTPASPGPPLDLRVQGAATPETPAPHPPYRALESLPVPPHHRGAPTALPLPEDG